MYSKSCYLSEQLISIFFMIVTVGIARTVIMKPQFCILYFRLYYWEILDNLRCPSEFNILLGRENCLPENDRTKNNDGQTTFPLKSTKLGLKWWDFYQHLLGHTLSSSELIQKCETKILKSFLDIMLCPRFLPG